MFRILHVSSDIALTDRLATALDGHAGVTRVEPAPEAMLEVAASIRPDLAVVDLGTGPAAMESGFRVLNAAQDAEVAWPIVALGADADGAVVLAAVRAGARDVLARDGDTALLHTHITRLLERSARGAQAPAGRLVAITAGQPNDGEGLFALNYAVAEALRGGEALLVDCHLPGNMAGPALDLGLNYTVRDAVHDLPRLDRTLLSGVLGRHRGSRLSVLPLSLGGREAADVSGDDILRLCGVLRRLFDSVVVNLAGLRHDTLLHGLVAQSSEAYIVASQSYASAKACRDLLAPLALAPDAIARLTLVVAEHDPAIMLSEAQLRTTLGLARSVTLPPARVALLNAANQGNPLLTAQPRSAYARALHRLVGTPPAPRRIGLPRWLAPRRRRTAPALPVGAAT